MMDDKKAYTRAIEESFQVYKVFNSIDRIFFEKDKTIWQLITSKILNKNEDKSEECLEDLAECESSFEKILSWKELPKDVFLKEYLSLLGKSIQLLSALITILKEAKDRNEKISFIEYKMMIDSYRAVKIQLDSRPEVKLGYTLEEGTRRGLFKEAV